MNNNIFLFEDQAVFREETKEFLTQKGYVVEDYHDFDIAMFNITSATTQWAAAVLDIMDDKSSPDAGFKLFDSLRKKWPNIPIVFLTDYANGSEARVRSIDLGAHQFIHKQDDLEHTLLLTVLNRFTTIDKTSIYQIGHLTVDIGKRTVLWRGRELEPKLGEMEFDVIDTIAVNTLSQINAGKTTRATTYREIADAAGIKRLDPDQVDEDSDKDPFKVIKALENQNVKKHVSKALSKFKKFETHLARTIPDINENTFDFKQDVIATINGQGYYWKQQ